MKLDDVGYVETAVVSPFAFSFAASPENWVNKAAELHLTAQVLRAYATGLIGERPQIKAVNFRMKHASRQFYLLQDPRESCLIWQTMMVAGFSLENVFKALVIAKDPSKVESGELDPKSFTHILGDLALGAGVVLTEEEKRLCEICTHAILIDGRYPTSRSAKKMPTRTHVNLDLNWPIYAGLYERSFLEAAKLVHGM